MKFLPLAAILGAVLPFAALAQPADEYQPLIAPLERMLAGCLDQSYDGDSALACNQLTSSACMAMGPDGDTTFGRVMCAGILSDLWDAELDRLWPLRQKGLSDEEAALLKTEQSAWIAYRDAACTFAVAEVAGGSMAAHVGSDCYVDLTAERVAQFREILRYR